MARKISGKVIVSAELEAKTAIHIGGTGGGDSVDLELAMDGRGRWYIPGTSLAGVMRAWFERNCRGQEFPALEIEAASCDSNPLLWVCKVMGFQKGDKGEASHLIVEDAVITGGIREIRDGVGIDSRTGTAAEGLKFTRAVLPRGVKFKLDVEVDLPCDDPTAGQVKTTAEQVKVAMRGFLDHLANHGLRLGAAKSRGLGKVGLLKDTNVQAKLYNFPGDLDAWLDDSKQFDTYSGVLTEEFTGSEEPLNVEIKWKPASPVMVKSGAEGGIADMLPLVSGIRNGVVAPVIPGSSVKGVLKNRAALILRTLLKDNLPEDERDKSGRPVKPEDWEAVTLVSDLFGSAMVSGRLFVEDTYQLDNPVDAEKWVAEDKETMNETTVHADHVAIDRFTGGASDSALFSDRTPKRDKAWEPIRIEVDFGRKVVTPTKAEADGNKKQGGNRVNKRDFGPNEKNAQLALLGLVLRDLKEGWIPIGFGSRRGMGEIAVESITIDGMFLDDYLGQDHLQNAWNELINREFRLNGKAVASG